MNAVSIAVALAYLLVNSGGAAVIPLDVDSLRYACVADTRLMQERLGFAPRYTAEEALREFAAQQRALVAVLGATLHEISHEIPSCCRFTANYFPVFLKYRFIHCHVYLLRVGFIQLYTFREFS